MAKEVVFSEVLCFIKNNFDKLSCSEIKPVLCNFYDDDELVAAKETLHKAVLNAVGDGTTLPRLPKRQGDGKSKLIVDDILKLFTIIDERKLDVPRFVAEELSRIPFVNADSINVLALAKKLDFLETRLHSVEQILSKAVISGVDDSVPGTCPADGDSAAFGAFDTDFPPLTVKMNHQNSDFGTSCDDDIRSDVDTDNAGWNKVTRRYCPDQPRRSTTQFAQVQRRQESVQKKKSKLFGTAHESNSAIKSGVEIVRKAVVHVDNLDANCTPELLKDYLLSKDINAVSCYKTKSWLKDDEKEKVTAFRVCVLADQRDKLMDGSLWSKGIILRDWKFKGKPAPQHGVH